MAEPTRLDDYGAEPTPLGGRKMKPVGARPLGAFTSSVAPPAAPGGKLPTAIPYSPAAPSPAPTPAAPGPFGGPGASLSPYTATNNLRGTQITPGAGSYAGQARAMALSDLTRLDGPDRGAIASDVYKRLVDESRPDFEAGVRDIGRDAARFGRLGSGVTTSRLGDLAAERERSLDLSRRALSSEAAGRSLDDRLGVFDARLRGAGDFYGAERAERDELRGERGFQNDMSQQALDNMVRQQTLEEMLLSGQFGRDMDYNKFLAGFGYGG